MNLASQLAYAALFQIGWLVCVCLGNLVAITFALSFAIFHLSCLKILYGSRQLLRESYWVLLISVMGYCLETFFFCAGLIYQHEPTELFVRFSFAPPWLLALWLCFAIALRTCLAFIFRRPLLIYGLITLAIPSSYVAGTYLNNSVHINKPYTLSLALITLSWMVFMALLQQIKHRYFEDMFHDC